MMKPRTLIPALCCLVALSVFAEKQPFGRYQSIVDRQMFGPLPPDFDPNKSPSEVQKSTSAQERELTKEQEQLKSAIHFSVLDVRPNGDVLVGFTDNSDPKVPRNYFLKVGESRDGWTVKEADPDDATMTIVKNDIEVSLTLGGNSAKGAGTTSRTGSSADAGAGTVRRSLLGSSTSLKGLRFRRKQAEADEQAKAEAEKAAAAAKEAERQQQAEAEKAQREAERAEQRQQLQAIQEELKRAREARAAAEAAKATAETKTDAGADNGGAEN